ncbi:MAG: DUF1643 domain-containing protein [Candidatus Paceibacterota bacterium]
MKKIVLSRPIVMKKSVSKPKSKKSRKTRKTNVEDDKIIIRDATFSKDNKYRYKLSRVWDDSKPKLLFIMLNPSIADGNKDDPTINRVIDFTKSWGYGGFYVGNLYAFISTDPKGLDNVTEKEGPDNIDRIKEMLIGVDKVIYGWGMHGPKKEPKWLKDLVKIPYCITHLKDGKPGHPSRLTNGLQLLLFKR